MGNHAKAILPIQRHSRPTVRAQNHLRRWILVSVKLGFPCWLEKCYLVGQAMKRRGLDMDVYELDADLVARCILLLDGREVVPAEFEEIAQTLLEEGLLSYSHGHWSITDDGHGYLYNINAPPPDRS